MKKQDSRLKLTLICSILTLLTLTACGDGEKQSAADESAVEASTAVDEAMADPIDEEAYQEVPVETNPTDELKTDEVITDDAIEAIPLENEPSSALKSAEPVEAIPVEAEPVLEDNSVSYDGGDEEPVIEDNSISYDEGDEEPVIVNDGASYEPETEPEIVVDGSTADEIINAIEAGDDLSDVLEPTAAGSPEPTLPDYEVKLAVDDSIAMGSSGDLIVWIGAETAEFKVSSNMVTDEKRIPSNLGEYAEITPYGPGFKVEPEKVKCVRITPSGSEVKFSITPLEEGNLSVSAQIKIYTTEDCSGAPVPKTASDLNVTVYVDKAKELKKKKKAFVDIFWEKLEEFWGAVLALFFGLILFLLRKKLKKLFGFEDQS